MGDSRRWVHHPTHRRESAESSAISFAGPVASAQAAEHFVVEVRLIQVYLYGRWMFDMRYGHRT